VNPDLRDERYGKMPDQPSDPAANPQALRDQAQRIRGYARDLAGDPAAGRLDNFADELDARADALEHQSASRRLESLLAVIALPIAPFLSPRRPYSRDSHPIRILIELS
jgi:hypothetical protein